MPTFLIKIDGVESISTYPHSSDAVIAARESSPECSCIAVSALPYGIGTKLTDLLTNEIFSITNITPTVVSYSGIAGSGTAARCQLATVFKIHGE